MLTRIQKVLAPPVFEHEEQTRRANLLNVLTLASMVIDVVLLSAIFATDASLIRLLRIGGAMLLQLFILFLMRRRHIQLASLLLGLGIWVIITLYSFLSGGLSSPTLGNYGTLVLCMGLVLGGRAGIGFAGLGMVGLVAMFYLPSQLVQPGQPIADTPLLRLFDQAASVGASAILVYMAIRSITGALERAHRNEQAQMEANRELTMLHAALEEHVAELERAEKSLRDSETVYHTLVENLPQSIFLKDREGRFVFANQPICDDFGKPLQDIVGKTHFDFHPKELSAKYGADDQAVIQSGQPLIGVSEPTVDAAGIRKWMLTTKVPFWESDGEIAGLVCMGRDITHQKQVEEDLAEERNLLRTLIENLPDRIYIKDAESHFLVVNTSQVQLLGGKTPEDLLGKSDLDFFASEIAEKYIAVEQVILRSGQPRLNNEEATVDPNGNKKWI